MFRFSNKKALGQGLRFKVHLLVPGEEIEISFNNNSTGQDVLNDVASQLDLLDKDYYGLKLYDHIQWLDPTKSVVKQTKSMSELILLLRFKYYPAEPALLANESTRYYLYLQLRADLLEGRLRSESQETLAYLIACVLQSELGDANTSPEISHKENYVADFKFVPNQTEELELAAIGLHQSEDFLGLSPSDSELNFLKKASLLDTYGIDPYPVKDGSSRNHFLIGVNHQGISTFQDSKRTNLFAWDELERISLDGKLVVVYCRKLDRKGDKVSKTRSLFAFRCPSQERAENFWKIATEHKFFFTLESTPESPIKTNTGGLFKKTHKLKYVGRVEKDLLRDHVDEVRSNGVKRSRSLMAKTNNEPMWQGFQKQGNSNNSNIQASLNNIYASDMINKTFPSNMNYFREEEEDEEGEMVEGAAGAPGDLDTRRQRRRTSAGSITNEAPAPFARKSALTSKAEAANKFNRQGSRTYGDPDQQKNDFIRASVFLILILGFLLLTIMLINDTDRPNSISYLLNRLNLEQVSLSLRQNYYLPLRLALKSAFSQLYSALDSRLL